MAEGATILSSLVAGGAAGFGVDAALFPLDTLKTRMQAANASVLLRNGGMFKGIYHGIGPAIMGSAPTAAVFFISYEQSKRVLGSVGGADNPVVHMASAVIGDVMACLVRVPVDNVKQKMQAGQYATGRATVRGILQSRGASGFYVGYVSTVLRDVPFSFIQFPIWERLKRFVAESQSAPCQPWQGAMCGSVSASIAAFLTTPFDLVKTRLMLGADAQGVPYKNIGDTFRRVYADGGLRMLYGGWQPRVGWVSIGGMIYFGLYEKVSEVVLDRDQQQQQR